MAVRALLVALCHCALVLAACDRAVDSPAAAQDPNAPDLARGELLSLACQACHTLDVGGAHLIGPSLHGVFGRRAGTLLDFEYSSSLKGTDLVWTPEALDAWLADPSGFIPGTTMAFTGYQLERDRRDLVAYLTQATKSQ